MQYLESNMVESFNTAMDRNAEDYNVSTFIESMCQVFPASSVYPHTPWFAANKAFLSVTATKARMLRFGSVFE